MDRIKSIKKSNFAVSEILGSMLLLSISVALFSTAYATLLTPEPDISLPSVYLEASIKDNKLVIEHLGGEDIDYEANIILTNNSGNSTTLIAKDYLEEEEVNNKWNIGERFICDLNDFASLPDFCFTRYEELSIQVIDVESHNTVMMGFLNEEQS